MGTSPTLIRAFCAGLFALVAVADARAEEGFWPFARFPAAAMAETHGWAPDGAWIARASAASARLSSGCSAAIVSREGLVLTNQHCLAPCLQEASAGTERLLISGFIARTREEERRCPNLKLSLFESEADVTEAIAAVARDAPDADFATVRDGEIARLERGCAAEGEERACEVVIQLGGARYVLTAFREFADVRLVFAPERAVAHFGGEAENFNFPRAAFDVAFARIYVGGAPAQTPTYLALRVNAFTAQESVVVMGSPGTTERLLTVSELAFERERRLPLQIALTLAWRDALAAGLAASGDADDALALQLFAAENALKSLQGRAAGAADPEIVARISAAETELRARVARNAMAHRDIGPAWDNLAAALARAAADYDAHQLLDAQFGAGSGLLDVARALVRAADAPATTRAPERGLALMRAVRLDALERARIEAWAAVAVTRLAPTHRVRRAIAEAGGPQAFAQQLLEQSRLADVAVRAELLSAGAAGVATSTDPAIALARLAEPQARALGVNHERDVALPIARAHLAIAQARFRAHGDKLYPDAARTPRLSYGRLEGWREGALARPQATTLRDLFAHPQAETLPQAWRDAPTALGDTLVMNVAISSDSVAGSSGSAVLDRAGAVAGVVFDGNAHALAGVYAYDGARHRTIALSSGLILAVLEQVYALPALAAEARGE
jgi:hypothetical protein